MYPIWWCDTVTVHHKGTDGNRVTWTPETFTGAFFRIEHGAQKASEFQRESYAGLCRFRGKANVAVGDIVTLGGNAETISDYVQGQRSTDYIAAHAGECFVVTSVHDNTHTYTGNPHTFAQGV